MKIFLGDQCVQEFEKRDGIIDMPRITSGYFYDQETNWDILNAASSIGVFSHFVHPDDILDENRNNHMNWDVMYKSYSDMLKETNERYPWIRSMTASKAANVLDNYLNSYDYYLMSGNVMTGYCDSFNTSMSYILRTSKNVEAIKDCQITTLDKNVYLVVASSNKFELRIS